MVVFDFKFLVVVVKVPSECHRYAMRLVCSSCLEISLKTSVSEIQSLCFDLVKYFIKHISNTSPSTHEVRYPWKCLQCFLISLLVDYREIKLEKNFWKQFPYSQHDNEKQRNKKGYTIRKVLTPPRPMMAEIREAMTSGSQVRDSFSGLFYVPLSFIEG